MRKVAMPIAMFALVMAATRGDVVWQSNYEEAITRARDENKLVFIAINMDGERANDELANTVYHDDQIVTLSESTLNMVASVSEHKGGQKICPRLGSLSCVEHREIDRSVREKILRVGNDDQIIAPQHIFLAPDGSVVLSVPWSITRDELAWCFHAAMRQIDASHEIPDEGSLRPPKALVMKGLASQEDESDSKSPQVSIRPPTREEVLVLIEQARKAKDNNALLEKILLADEPEVLDYLKTELKSSAMGMGGGFQRNLTIRKLGMVSPPSFWKVLSDWAIDGSADTRREVAIALEQLADPESMKIVKSAYTREKDASVRLDWLRALGTVGADDEWAMKTVITAMTHKDVEMRIAAILAAGWMSRNEEIDQALLASLEDPEPRVRQAAACAMTFTRRSSFVAPLVQRSEQEEDPPTKGIVTRALMVLRGENLRLIRKDVAALTGEKIQRFRFYL